MKKKTKIFIASAFAVLAMAGVGTGIYYATQTDKPPVEDNISVDPGVTPPDDGGEEQPLVHAMTFKVGEETLPAVNVATGGLITPPTDPTKEGYIFAGWALEGTETPVDFSTLIATENMTFVALFEEITYQVTFSVDGKETTQQVAYQGLAVAPTDPVKEGYIFTGWALQGTTEIVDITITPINENTTFVAIFIEEPVKVTSASKFTFSDNTLTGYVGEDVDVVIPASYSLDGSGNPIDGEDIQVTVIDDAFKFNENIKSVVIPDGVTSVGSFSSCSALESITIPESVKTFKTFYGCSSLKELNIPEGVTSLAAQFAQSCTALESVTLPSTLTYIGDSAFYSCSSLKELTIPEGVTTFKESVFNDCTSLERVSLPSTLSSVSGNPFKNCTSLISIVVSSDNLTFDSRDNCNAIIETSTNTLITGCKTSIVPGSVKIIGSYSFYFIDVSNVVISDGVESILGNAFYSAKADSLTIPSSVVNFETFAFGTYDIKNYIFTSSTPATLSSKVFFAGNFKIFVPDDAVDTYKEALKDYADQIKPVSEYVA